MALALSKKSINEKSDQAGAWFDRIQGLQITRRLGLMAMIAIAVAAGLAAFLWSQQPAYTPLYTGLDDKATAEATDLLRSAGIAFKLNPATGAISVPEANLHDARLKLAGSGLTDSGRLGFEMMEKDPGFGVSQFVENARYQHALETELARTISSLRPVRDARVHLAIPKPSAFTRQREVSSASVVLEMRGGQSLERNQVDAIVHLVATSIPELAPERVTVVDQSGRMLSIADPNSEAAQNAVQFEQVRRQENSYSQRIRELLEPMTGPGRVNPEVSVDMDFSVVEEARELYNGEPAKLRSEQVSENSSNATGPQGVPGAASNTPAGGNAAAAAGNAQQTAATPTESSKNATRNYELDRTLQHTRQPAGRIRRVSVAVLVDHVPRVGSNGKLSEQPLSAAELTRIESLVKQAVGFDSERGDTVSVMNAPFVRTPTTPIEAPHWWESPNVQNWLRLGVGAAIVLALCFGVLRPALRQITGPLPAAAKRNGKRIEPQSAEVKMLDDDVAVSQLQEDSARISSAAQQASIPLPPDPYETKLRQAREAVKTDSKRVAQVVKGWVSNEG
jgi:flagellar M-ring protein FliF